MNMEAVKQLMKEVGWGTLATTDGKKVGVRPMGGWAWFAGELWCASAKDSDKVRQLQAVPHAEYCFCNSEGRHVRLAGPCLVSTNNADKRKLYDAVPVLKDYIKDPADPNYVVIRMRPDRVRVIKADDLTYEEVEP